ncbi:hypothetical protein [Ornithinimicrobium kibberense]|uniref:hypothetical protein n=1 Tax=Ornithinimicrobium kibberense TaxID=282060 RepID=UPI003607CB23
MGDPHLRVPPGDTGVVEHHVGGGLVPPQGRHRRGEGYAASVHLERGARPPGPGRAAGGRRRLVAELGGAALVAALVAAGVTSVVAALAPRSPGCC